MVDILTAWLLIHVALLPFVFSQLLRTHDHARSQSGTGRHVTLG
jgi:hypothetical protein